MEGGGWCEVLGREYVVVMDMFLFICLGGVYLMYLFITRMRPS